MNIAVTGGSGRLGRVLVRLLLQNGHRVLSIDRVENPLNQKASNQLRFEDVDLVNLPQVVAALQGCEAVVHLAAYPGPQFEPVGIVYANNTLASYNVLQAATSVGIQKICLASSVNALGGAGSRIGRFDYFPVDELHPTFNEDDYSLSKWVMEAQGDSFARRYASATISSLRFHALPDEPPELQTSWDTAEAGVARTLWGWTLISEAARACELAVQADFKGHEVFYITAQTTGSTIPSVELARFAYPQIPIRGDLSGRRSFFDCRKAEQLLKWVHAG